MTIYALMIQGRAKAAAFHGITSLKPAADAWQLASPNHFYSDFFSNEEDEINDVQMEAHAMETEYEAE